MNLGLNAPQLGKIARGANLAGHEWTMQAKGWMHTGGLALLAGATTFFLLGIPLGWLRRHADVAAFVVPILEWVVSGTVVAFALHYAAGLWKKKRKSAEDPPWARRPAIIGVLIVLGLLFIALGYYDATVGLRRLLLQWVPASAVTWFALRRIASGYKAKGEQADEDEFIEGARLISQKELAEAVQQSPKGPGPYVFAGVPIPKGRHRLNFLATGSTGSGKTQALLPLMQQVDDRGISSITYDRKPEFVGMRYRQGSSIILNPMDARSPQWDLFGDATGGGGEITNIYHYKMYADALIPEEKAGSPFWYLGSRIIFADILAMLKTQRATSVRELYEACCEWSHEKLFAELANYPMSTKFLDPEKKSSKELHSSLMSRTAFLQYFTDKGPKFSIRDWVRSEPKGQQIFLTSNPETHPVIMPVYALFLEIAVNALMSLPDVGGGDDERMWFFLDEFSSMNVLPSAEPLLTQARSKGAVTFIGVQDEAQMKDRYGPDVAQMIRSGLQTKLVLHTADAQAAKMYSEALGMGVWREKSDTMSMRAEAGSDAMSIGSRRGQPRPAVSITDIMRTPVGHGFLQLTDDYQPARVTYPETKVDRKVPDFVPRPELLIQSTGMPRPEHELQPVVLDPEDEKFVAAEQAKKAQMIPSVAEDVWDGR